MAPVEIYSGEVEDEQIISLFKQGDWETLLHKHSKNKFLPWIWPSFEDLRFITESARAAGAHGIVSIGCGSALLEWLIKQSTGMAVKCVEVDKSWWNSKYSYSFLPLEFTEKYEKGHSVSKVDDALLFCYFNNEPAFLDYLRLYEGNCIIIIGPGPKRGTFTSPSPFQLPYIIEGHWILHDRKELSSKNDFTAVFTRKKAPNGSGDI